MASEQPKSQAPAEPLWRRVVDVLWYPPAERKKQQKHRRERAQAGLKASSFESQELSWKFFVLQGIGLLSAGLVGRYDECVPVCGPRGRARNNIGLSDNLYMLHSGRIGYVGCSHFRLGCTQIAGGELPREDCSARSGIDVCAVPRESEARLDSRRRMYRRDSVDCY